MDQEIAAVYGKKVRVRVCGLCWEDNKLLLVNHKSLQPSNFWSPPGGGLEFGERIEGALKREFLEETGLEITVTRFAFGCELIKDPLHAVELFFHVKKLGGMLITGYDPELQIIQGSKFMSEAEILQIPPQELHGILSVAHDEPGLNQLSGFYSI